VVEGTGDRVAKGDPIVAIETDKVTVENKDRSFCRSSGWRSLSGRDSSPPRADDVVQPVRSMKDVEPLMDFDGATRSVDNHGRQSSRRN